MRLVFALFVFELLVALQGLWAWEHAMFWDWQMQAAYHVRGLPFAWHGGMWADEGPFSLVAAWAIWRYWKAWSAKRIWLAIGWSSVGSLILNALYVMMPQSLNPHVIAKSLTLAGWVHAVYVVAAYAPIILFFVTDAIRRWEFWSAAALVTLGAILGIFEPAWYNHESLFNLGIKIELGGLLAAAALVATYRRCAHLELVA